LEVGGTKLVADVVQRFAEQFPSLKGLLSDVRDDVDMINGKAELFRQLKEGAESVKTAMKAQLALSFLNEYDIALRQKNSEENPIWHFRMNGVAFHTYGNDRVYDVATQQFTGARTSDGMAAVVAAVSDPEGLLAGKLNLHPDAVRMLSHMLALGVPLEWSLKLMMQPVVREYYHTLKKLRMPYKVPPKDTNDNAFSSLAGKHKLGSQMLIKLKDRVKSRGLKANVLELNDQLLDDNIVTEGVNVSYEFSVLSVFLELQQQAEFFTALADLLPIGNGFTAKDFDSFALFMRKLGLHLDDDAFERSSIPVDLRQALLGVDKQKPYHELLATQVGIYKQLQPLMKTVFLERTDFFGEMKKGALANLDVEDVDRGAFEEQLTNDLISFLGIKVYKKTLADNNEKVRLLSLTNGMIYDDVAEQKPAGFLNAVETLLAIREKMPDNYFVKRFLHAITPEIVTKEHGELVKNPHSYGGINKVEVNSWAKLNRFRVADLQDSFLEIYQNEETNHLAWALFHYLLVKDGLQWRSGSFMKFVPNFMFQELTDGLRKANELFARKASDADFIALFGITSKQLLNEFATSYILHAANAEHIPKRNLKGASRTMSYSKTFKATTAIAKYEPQTHQLHEGVLTFDLWGGLGKESKGSNKSKGSEASEGLEEGKKVKETKEEELERLKFEKNLASITGRGFEVRGFEEEGSREGVVVFPFLVYDFADDKDEGQKKKVFYRLESVDGKKAYDVDSFHFMSAKEKVALGTKAVYVPVQLRGSAEQWAGGGVFDRLPTERKVIRDPKPITERVGFSVDGYRGSVNKQLDEAMYGEAGESWLQAHSSKVQTFEEEHGVRVQIVDGDVANIRFLKGGVLAAGQQELKRLFFSVSEELKAAQARLASDLWQSAFEDWMKKNAKKIGSFEGRYKLDVRVNYDAAADPVIEFYNRNTDKLAINQNRLRQNLFEYVKSQPAVVQEGPVGITKEGRLLEQGVEVPPMSEAAEFYLNAKFPEEDLLVHRGELPFNELAMQMAPVIHLIEGHPYYEEMAEMVRKTMRKLRC
jgi:hypothetical protein